MSSYVSVRTRVAILEWVPEHTRPEAAKRPARPTPSFSSPPPLQLELLVIWLLLIGTVIATFFVQRHRVTALPPAAASMLLGVVAGFVLRVAGLPPFRFSPSTFFYGLLPPIVFASGFTLKTKGFFRNLGTITAFAVLGTALSTLVLGFSTYALYLVGIVRRKHLGPQPLIECMLYGALLSATDTVATLSVFGSVGATPPLLFHLVFGESVLNDAAAIVLFRTLAEFYVAPATRFLPFKIALRFAHVLLGSAATGVGVALGCAFVLKRFELAPDAVDAGGDGGAARAAAARARQAASGLAFTGSEVYEMCLVVMGAYLAYLVAEVLALSGIVALFAAGIAHAHYSNHSVSPDARIALTRTFEMAAFLCETFVFAYLGLQAREGGAGRPPRARRAARRPPPPFPLPRSPPSSPAPSTGASSSPSSPCASPGGRRPCSRWRAWSTRGGRSRSRPPSPAPCGLPACAARWRTGWRSTCPTSTPSRVVRGAGGEGGGGGARRARGRPSPLPPRRPARDRGRDPGRCRRVHPARGHVDARRAGGAGPDRRERRRPRGRGAHGSPRPLPRRRRRRGRRRRGRHRADGRAGRPFCGGRRPPAQTALWRPAERRLSLLRRRRRRRRMRAAGGARGRGLRAAAGGGRRVTREGGWRGEGRGGWFSAHRGAHTHSLLPRRPSFFLASMRRRALVLAALAALALAGPAGASAKKRAKKGGDAAPDEGAAVQVGD